MHDRIPFYILGMESVEQLRELFPKFNLPVFAHFNDVANQDDKVWAAFNAPSNPWKPHPDSSRNIFSYHLIPAEKPVEKPSKQGKTPSEEA